MADDTADFVARHDPDIPRDELLEDIGERTSFLRALRESLVGRPGNLVSFANEARALAGLSHLATPDTPEIVSYLRMMARAIAAAAARAIPGGGPVRIDLDGLGPIELPPAQELPIPLLQPRYIVDAYHAAFAVGDEPALALLADAPIERLARTPPSAQDRAYLLPHALGLKRVARGDVAGNRLLMDTVKGWESPSLVPATRDYALFLVSPEAELALLHAQSDHEPRAAGLPTFNEALCKALVMHRRYWRDFEPNPGERVTRDPGGFIALGPLAWAAMRHYRGLPVGITSDYLPQSVIQSRRVRSSGPA
jgi:hypothetical protein